MFRSSITRRYMVSPYADLSALSKSACLQKFNKSMPGHTSHLILQIGRQLKAIYNVVTR